MSAANCDTIAISPRPSSHLAALVTTYVNPACGRPFAQSEGYHGRA
jgi:hypothetical protein